MTDLFFHGYLIILSSTHFKKKDNQTENMIKQMLVVGVLSLFVSHQIVAQCVKGNCQNGYGTFKYRSGATYQGNFRNGQIHGQGILYFSNGDKYIGQWKNRYREGKGKLTFHNGDVYQGNFIRNEFNGHGVIEFANGDESPQKPEKQSKWRRMEQRFEPKGQSLQCTR